MPFLVTLPAISGFVLLKYEHWTIDAFEMWCWRRLLRIPWTTRRSNQLILKGINPEYSLEGQMLKLNLHYFGHLIQRASSLEKTLMLGKIEGRRRRGNRRWDDWMASPTQCTWVWANSGRWWRTGKPGMLQSMGLQESDMTEWLNWTELKHCAWWKKPITQDRMRLILFMWNALRTYENV